MIEIELQADVVGAHLEDRRPRPLRRIEEEARNVDLVDRLDDDRDTMVGRHRRTLLEVRDIGRPVRAMVPESRHRVQQLAPRRLRVRERLSHRRLELLLPPRHRGQPPLALGPVPRRQVEQRLRQPVCLQPRCDLVRRPLVGKQELHALEAGLGGRLEPVEKIDLGEHHRQVGGKLNHLELPLHSKRLFHSNRLRPRSYQYRSAGMPPLGGKHHDPALKARTRPRSGTSSPSRTRSRRMPDRPPPSRSPPACRAGPSAGGR